MKIKWKLTSKIKNFQGVGDIDLDGARSWEKNNTFYILAGDFIYETECENDWNIVLLMLSTVVTGIAIKSKNDRIGVIVKSHPLTSTEPRMTLAELIEHNYGNGPQ